ncbi:GntR family transcriptional regulator [Rhizobium sp. NZLR11]|uniref:GntR family transcriptional regulator n=1 Tax=Rhizobium sp. NZLR11 TaxID=2731098 RepID=UPI001C83A281|nr:GntR family transcriptional regulator [Rhizobium sp. NZLR11]MBX5210516.1 GntR family transcriptional regulator [Rhizobium sp. NZLR11]
MEPLSLRPTPEIIADRVRSQIVSGKFAPGERLQDAKISQQLGVSRGPVREALQRLVQEGLLINTLNRGVCVVDISVDDLLDVFTARRAVEREAFLIVFRSKPVALFEKLRKVIHSMEKAAANDDWRAAANHDIKFHTMIVEASGSPRLSRIYATLAAERHLCMSKEFAIFRDLNKLASMHQPLVEALEGDSQTTVVKVLDEHLRSGMELAQPGKQSLAS